MADSVRVVTFQTGGQITEVAALQSGLGWDVNSLGFTRDTLGIIRGDRNQQMTPRGGRYDGEFFGGERVSNSVYKFQALAYAAGADALIAKLNALYTVFERMPGPLYIEHKDDGATYPTYREIRAPAKAQENRSWMQRMGAGSVAVDVEWPVAPLGSGPPMDVTDTAVMTNIGDYTFDDALGSAGFPTSAGALATERRIVHSSRGYTQGSCQVTASAAPGPTISGYKLGAIPKRTAANTYLDVYVDDNGTNSRLRIDTVVAGTRTNRFTVNLAARIVNGTTFWVRGRIEDSIVYAEYFSSVAVSAPEPYDTPTSSGSYTLLTTDLAALGINVAGRGGYDWIPQHASASVPTLTIQPYTYRNRTLPGLWRLDGVIPGTASASVTATFAQPGPLNGFGKLAWFPRPSLGSAPSLPGFYEAEAGSNKVGWATTADATCRGGSLLQVTAAGALAFTGCHVDIALPNSGFVADDNSSTMSIEVWAAVKIGSGLVSPKMRAYVSAVSSSQIGTLEYGSTGKPLPVPTAGTVRRIVRLGTLIVDEEAVRAGLFISIEGSCAAGSAGSFGLDYIEVCSATRRASSPTGKAQGSVFFGSSYPFFIPSRVVRIGSNLAGRSGAYESRMLPSSGFCGAPLEMGGVVDVQAQASNLVPDDPTSNAATETATQTVSVRFSIVPRYINQRAD